MQIQIILTCISMIEKTLLVKSYMNYTGSQFYANFRSV